jgi:hypothetical protein
LEVVDHFSSTIDDPMEINSDIPDYHSNMTKYSSFTDPRFVSISNTLLRWMKKIDPKIEQGMLSRALRQESWFAM